MYVIYRFGRRFNNKTFRTYEDARKYVRRKLTELAGYHDSISWAGFKIANH